jgi:hypothetical protein
MLNLFQHPIIQRGLLSVQLCIFNLHNGLHEVDQACVMLKQVQHHITFFTSLQKYPPHSRLAGHHPGQPGNLLKS